MWQQIFLLRLTIWPSECNHKQLFNMQHFILKKIYIYTIFFILLLLLYNFNLLETLL